MSLHVVPPPLDPDTDQSVGPVIVTLPECSDGTQVLIQHYPHGVEVALRPEPWATWTPASLAGAEVEVRSR